MPLPSPEVIAAIRLARSGRGIEAMPALAHALRDDPADLAMLGMVTTLLDASNRGDELIALHDVIASTLPNEAQVLAGWAHAMREVGALDRALELLDRAIAAVPARAATDGSLAGLLSPGGDPEGDCRLLGALVERHPDDPGLLRPYATKLIETEHLAQAVAILDRLRKLDVADPWAHVELGRLALGMGESAAARVHFLAALRANPDYAAALWELAQVDGWQVEPALLDRITTLCRRERDPKALAGLHAALARCQDRAGAFESAGRHASIAKSLLASQADPRLRSDPLAHRARIDATIRDWTTDRLQRLGHAGSHDPRPVFVIGLPRSGTTLLERMLAAHPQIVGVGEQTLAVAAWQRALRNTAGGLAGLTATAVAAAANWHLQELEERTRRLGLDPCARRIVDKMPDNYLLAGWLQLAFPRAVIVHCLRDPRDVALSCWLTQFAGTPWSLSLDHIADRIEQHRRLLRHWRAHLATGFIEVRYEDLVTDPTDTLGRVLAAMGMPWDRRMFDFAGGHGFVASASRQQVREPLHRRGMGRWRDYQATLRPVLARLEAIATADDLERGSLRGTHAAAGGTA